MDFCLLLLPHEAAQGAICRKAPGLQLCIACLPLLLGLLLSGTIPNAGGMAGWCRGPGDGARGAVMWHVFALPQAPLEPTTALRSMGLL